VLSRKFLARVQAMLERGRSVNVWCVDQLTMLVRACLPACAHPGRDLTACIISGAAHKGALCSTTKSTSAARKCVRVALLACSLLIVMSNSILASAASEAASASAVSGPLGLLRRAFHFVMHLDKELMSIVANYGEPAATESGLVVSVTERDRQSN